MYLKLQVNLTAIIPDICACSETAWAWVGETCVKKHVKFNFHSLQIYTWNLIWSAHGKVCETASELLLPFTVKLYVKPHVKYMWKCVWKGLNCFTLFSHISCEVHNMKRHVKLKVNFYCNWCELICETSCEVYVKMCVKGITLFHTLFT